MIHQTLEASNAINVFQSFIKEYCFVVPHILWLLYSQLQYFVVIYLRQLLIN